MVPGSAQAESLQRVVLSAEMYERLGSERSHTPKGYKIPWRVGHGVPICAKID